MEQERKNKMEKLIDNYDLIMAMLNNYQNHHKKVASSSHTINQTEKRDVGIAGSSNRFARGSDQNSGNVLTDKPITRVLAPPGGRSSITFG